MGEGWEEVLGMQRGRLKSRVRGGDKRMKALAKDHSVRKEGLQELGYRRPSRWVGLQGRGVWETGLPLEFRVELLSKSLAPGIYKTRLKTAKGHPEVPDSKRSASGEYDILLDTWLPCLSFRDLSRCLDP